MKATAKAHTNIALIKYWGKRDDTLKLPMNNSLSLTLDALHTTTTVEFNPELEHDIFYLNDEKIQGISYQRVSSFLDLVREYGDQKEHALVKSINEVPTAAGFASSASGFAALAGAATKAMGLDINDQNLSRLTRQGSGSACRSIYGGFVEWQKGNQTDGSDSFAVQLEEESYWDIRVAAVVLFDEEKTVSSSEGMKRTVDTSVFYDGWVDSIPADLQTIKEGIHEKDFEKVGSIAEANCLRMHGTTFGAKPPFTYWSNATFTVMETVQRMREEGIPMYFTIDAGPNVKVLYLPEHESVIQEKLHSIPGVKNLVLSRLGRGITYS